MKTYNKFKNADQVRLKTHLRTDHDPNWTYTVFRVGKDICYIQNNENLFCMSCHTDNLELISKKKKIKINLNG